MRKAVVVLALVLLAVSTASPMMMVKASETTNDFYLKMYPTIVNPEWQHAADNRKVLFHVTEEGILKNLQNVEVGTITLDVVAEILDIEALTGVVTAKYEINFDSGEIIYGTITGKLLNAVQSDMELDGKFVGHGDMHVMGEVYIIMEGLPVIVFDGYSW